LQFQVKFHLKSDISVFLSGKVFNCDSCLHCFWSFCAISTF